MERLFQRPQERERKLEKPKIVVFTLIINAHEYQGKEKVFERSFELNGMKLMNDGIIGEVEIGTGSKNDLVLNNPFVNKKAGVIRVIKFGVKFNSIFINECDKQARVGAKVVNPGDIIQVNNNDLIILGVKGNESLLKIRYSVKKG
ncbi:MAG TPA: hypothetical protein VJG30_00590 [Candidatus Nanoarchaeia archaeon]|nr:hypothetical protein [Candidatus Nanoarchaeia archaeon]